MKAKQPKATETTSLQSDTVAHVLIAAHAWFDRAHLRKRTLKIKSGLPGVKDGPLNKRRLQPSLAERVADRTGWTEDEVEMVVADKEQAGLVGYYTRHEFCACCERVTMHRFLYHVGSLEHLAEAHSCNEHQLKRLVSMMKRFSVLRVRNDLARGVVRLLAATERVTDPNHTEGFLASIVQGYIAEQTGPFLFDPDEVYRGG